jgi:hypothetical protein
MELLRINSTRLAEVVHKVAGPKPENLPFRILQPESEFIHNCKLLAPHMGKDFPYNALFLLTPLIRGQNTQLQFNRISNIDYLAKHAHLFDPEYISTSTPKDITEATSSFLGTRGYANTYLDFGWYYNGNLLAMHYQNSYLKFITTHHRQAPEIVSHLYVGHRAKTQTKIDHQGPLGYGLKLATLNVQWINQYLYRLKDADQIGIPVDALISKILIMTGALVLNEPVNADLVTRRTIHPAIQAIINSEKSLIPRPISERLWSIGSTLCPKRNCSPCPLTDICSKKRVRLGDNDGKFYPLN